MTTGKRQPPLWIDMSFAEALERFAGTDPKEAGQNADAEAAKRKPAKAGPEPPKLEGRATRRQTRPA